MLVVFVLSIIVVISSMENKEFDYVYFSEWEPTHFSNNE